MRKYSWLLLSIILLQSCGFGGGEYEVIIEDRYSLTLPSFLRKGKDLNEDASLQYQNEWREFYVIVIDEAKEELQTALEDNDLEDYYDNNLEGYSDIILTDFVETIEQSSQSDIIDTVINNMPAKLTSLSGATEDGVGVFFLIAIVEGKDRYYQVLTWTIADRRNRHQSKMNKILYSLKEIIPEKGMNARE